jgi:hypothetical protein
MELDVDHADLVLYARFLPSWERIEPLRIYLEACTKQRPNFANAEGASIVVQELLENAVKYSLPSCPIELEVYMPLSAGALEIRVTNQASPTRIAMLSQELRLTQGDSARNAFASALSRLKSLPAGESMLGLSRVATTATLKSDVTDHRVVMFARLV